MKAASFWLVLEKLIRKSLVINKVQFCLRGLSAKAKASPGLMNILTPEQEFNLNLAVLKEEEEERLSLSIK